MLPFRGRPLVTAANEPPKRETAVVLALEQVEDHRVAHTEPGHERLRRGLLKSPERVGIPMRVSPLRRLPHLDLAELLRITAGLRPKLVVLDRVLRRLRDDAAVRVEAPPPRAPRDLLEVAHR